MDPRKIKLTDQVNLIRDKKKQVYTFTVLTFVVIVILVIGAIKPSVETMIRLNREITQKKTLREKLEEKRTSLNQLALQYAEFEETAKDLELIFPTNSDFSLFLANIESLSEESGFDLKNITFGSSSRQNESYEILTPVEVHLSVTGPSEGIIPFLKKLESLPMYPEVHALHYDASEEEDNRSYSINLSIYEVKKESFYE